MEANSGFATSCRRRALARDFTEGPIAHHQRRRWHASKLRSSMRPRNTPMTITAESPVESPPSSFYPWALVLMLFPVALLNYLDRMMVATMRASIRADIPTIANDAQFGVLMALFMWVYAAF